MDCTFCRRMQECCPVMVETLRDLIQKDVDPATLQLRAYYKYQVAVPSFQGTPENFQALVKKAVYDLDLKQDLERSEVINWCRTTKHLHALKTTADGSCLLHAISQALWGIEDTNQFLRQLIYCKISLDVGGNYKKRWLMQQRSFLSSMQEEFRLDTKEYNLEWENVIKASDSAASPDVYGLPYRTLESIHLYVAANVLKRPIIVLADSVARNVYGQSLQENHIGGIYLPLDTHPQQCHKSPLIIGYNCNHFAPLVFELDRTKDCVEMYAIPIVTQKFMMLECKFLLPHEEGGSQKLLESYLNMKEVIYDGVQIPAAVVNHTPLPETVDIVSAFRKNCEVKFQKMTGLVVGQGPKLPPTNAPVALPPNIQQLRPPPEGMSQNRKCLTERCNIPSEQPNEFCESCFKDFTVRCAKQEEAKRQVSNRAGPIYGNQPTAMTVRSEENQYIPESRPQYFDLSMMVEDCKAKCGFKCSTETHPYCHECYPKYVKTTKPSQPAVNTEAGNLLSMMPDSCHTAGCGYKCSRATYPYCHQCYDQHRMVLAERPTAPPRSMEEHLLSQRLQLEDPQTPRPFSEPLVGSRHQNGVVSLRAEFMNTVNPGASGAVNTSVTQPTEYLPNCRTIGCTSKAESGLEGYCDHCYQLCLFEPNIPPAANASALSPVCPLPNCGKYMDMPEMRMCNDCFHIKNGQNGETENLLREMNIALTEERKRVNSSDQDPMVRYQSGGAARSMPEEHDENQAIGNPMANHTLAAHTERYKKYSTGHKHICATPGCEGTRIELSGLCQLCEVRPEATREIGEPILSNQPEASASPALTEEELRRLNPVVLSSKDKVKCSYPSCTNMIYPPKKLCDSCIALLDQATSKSRQISDTQAIKDEGEHKRCRTKGCQFFGTKEFNGYCSSCHKGIVPTKESVTEPLSTKKKSPPTSSPYKTEPIAVKSSTAMPASQRGQHCIETGCNRFGDPAQDNRCSHHYKESRRLVPQTSDQSLAMILTALDPSQHPAFIKQLQVTGVPNDGEQHAMKLAGTKRVTTSKVQPTQNGDQFLQIYGNLESSRKSNKLCKNEPLIGCRYYGNSKTGGYCNKCYEQMKKINQFRQQ